MTFEDKVNGSNFGEAKGSAKFRLSKRNEKEFSFPNVRNLLKSSEIHFEPLDKGRLSLGDEGDAFRAKRGKNAGFRDEEFELARL